MARIGTDIQIACDYLAQHEVVAVPTETVYGLAGNALDEAAVLRIFEVKNRPSFDPLIVHVADIQAVERYVAHFPEKLNLLAQQFWPGPLTLLLPKKAIVPDLVTSGLDRVAIRVPAHPLMQSLLRKLPFPLAAPSANPFGYISPTTAAHVAAQLGESIPYILDGGPCAVGLESTIIGMEEGQLMLYRLGGLSHEHLVKAAGPIQISLNQSSNPAAPGMLKSHYAPRVPLRLRFVHDIAPPPPPQKAGLITFRKTGPLEGFAKQACLSQNGDLKEAAQNLFAALRDMDAAGLDILYAEPCPDEGLGRAINDRLRRAAAEN